MKKLALIVGLLSMIAASAQAYSYTKPNFYGGYDYYSGNSFGYSKPNFYGGYDFYSGNTFGYSKPNFYGGYDFYGPLFD